jgi:hypothetical protein
MATSVHKTAIVETMDGTSILVAPLKIKYLREFMDSFNFMKDAPNDSIALTFMSDCVRVAMQQLYPSISTVSQVEDMFDLSTMRTILHISAGISVDPEEEDLAEQAKSDKEGNSWETFDLVALEAEVFSLGIWKDFDDLEQSLSLQELTAILEAKRERDYEDKKFAAALQGVDLDEQSGKKKEEDPWEAMKARVFSGGKANDSNDILAYQGQNANKAGFGIGMGLGYEDLRQKS